MKEPRVTYQPIGRLGNQMFQCAAAIGYAKKYNVGWACPNDTKEVPRFHDFFPGLPRYDGHEFKRYNAADPSQFNYWPIPENKNGTKLVGFFQSEKFFEGAHDDVKRTFRLNYSYAAMSRGLVSIHIRRGDYVQHSNSFPPITGEYIDQAINKIKSFGYDVTELVCFSDDIPWCRKNLTSFGRITVRYSEGRSELEDLSLMASCDHHIIANSTFSWWGAWLGHNPDKIIVSPSADNWFGPGFTGEVPKDLIPSSWHQIKFR
jgi:hypothetical protein